MSKEIKSLFESYHEKENFSGVGLVKQGNDILFHQAYGLAHRGLNVPNQLDTKFDTASITKIFTAVAILQLVDKKLLSLEDKALSIIDIGESKISEDVTVFQLLTHTSGIADDADEEAGESYEAIWQERPNYMVKEAKDYLAQFANKRPNFPPGQGCRYNNCAYILLALIIEKLSGKNYREYVQENIFDVVGMKDTGFFAMDQVAEKAAEHYTSILDEQEDVIGYRKNIYSYPSIGSGDAGALTTPADLDLFIRTLISGKLLSPELTEDILKPKVLYRTYEQSRMKQEMGYGFQFFMSLDTQEIVYFQKDGMNAGVSCVMNYHLHRDLTVIIMANQDTDVWNLAWEAQKLAKGK